MSRILAIIMLMTLVAACAQQLGEVNEEARMENPELNTTEEESKTAIFAGGCFWCMEPPFEKLDGVLAVESGYAGGEEERPTYKQVSSGSTSHREAIIITYNPEKITYKELLEVYWRQIDPTDDSGSFVDRGLQYTSAIFYADEEEKAIAEESKRLVAERLGKGVATAILPASTFFEAEEYHQDYYKKNPLRYKYYRQGSGRDAYIQSVWQKNNASLFPESEETTGTAKQQLRFTKPSEAEIKAMLTPLQYDVTQKEATEAPFENEYWNNTAEGIYVDIITGEPLFSSADQYRSGTGWPSFTKPITDEYVVTKKDYKLILPRTEVRSKIGDNHLGHLFDDGPAPTGQRYCMNSAAMRFIPKERLEEEGYGEYLSLLKDNS